MPIKFMKSSEILKRSSGKIYIFRWNWRREEADRGTDHNAHYEEKHPEVQVMEVLDDTRTAIVRLVSARHYWVYVFPHEPQYADQES